MKQTIATSFLSLLSFCAIAVAQDVPTSRPALTDAQAQLRFDSLQRSVQNIDDINLIITRYEQFLPIVQDTALAPKVQEQLKLWQDRQSRNAKRVGDQWLDAGQMDQLDTQASVLALAAREQYLLGDRDKAAELLNQAVTTWPDNLTALYLRALASQDSAQAQQLFDKVRAFIPAHAPTLNNLAKLNIEAGKPQMAVVAMALALEASPDVQLLIDNAKELQPLLPENVRQSPAGLQLQQLLDQQEPALVAAQQLLGLQRVGATWLDSKTLDLLKAQASTLEERSAPLIAQRQQLADELRPLHTELQANIAVLQQIQFEVNRSRASTYPDSYFRIQARNNEIRANIDRTATQLQRVEAQLDLFKSDTPDARLSGFTGKLQPIGLDGVPVKPDHLRAFERGFVPGFAPSTQPTTQPTILPAAN
jgi:hypothetical protein